MATDIRRAAAPGMLLCLVLAGLLAIPEVRTYQLLPLVAVVGIGAAALLVSVVNRGRTILDVGAHGFVVGPEPQGTSTGAKLLTIPWPMVAEINVVPDPRLPAPGVTSPELEVVLRSSVSNAWQAAEALPKAVRSQGRLVRRIGPDLEAEKLSEVVTTRSRRPAEGPGEEGGRRWTGGQPGGPCAAIMTPSVRGWATLP